MADRPLFIFGAGGFGREVAWLASSAGYSPEMLTFLVEPGYNTESVIDGIPVRLLGVDDFERGANCVIAVGDPAGRRRAAELIERDGFAFHSLVHPQTQMSARVHVGEGSVICAGNILTTNVLVGAHVHINLSCTIGHDAQIGDYTSIAPGVNISGNVRIGSGVYIGTGASIINGDAGDPLTVGDNSIVAAGACVTRPVEPDSMVAGVPAVRKR